MIIDVHGVAYQRFAKGEMSHAPDFRNDYCRRADGG
jgi:hypothetical protein